MSFTSKLLWFAKAFLLCTGSLFKVCCVLTDNKSELNLKIERIDFFHFVEKFFEFAHNSKY